MDQYSGPRRDRPETIHSNYAKGLFLIVAICTLTAIMFLSIGLTELGRPVRKIEPDRLNAILGIGGFAALVALMGFNALRKEWSEGSPVYVEFKDKQLRNILIEDRVYFLAKDIVDSVFSDDKDRKRELIGFGQRRGFKRVNGKLFVSIEAIEKFLSARNDRNSILMLREIRRLEYSRDRENIH